MRTVIVILLAALTALCSAQEIPTLASTTAAAAPAATVTAPSTPFDLTSVVQSVVNSPCFSGCLTNAGSLITNFNEVVSLCQSPAVSTTLLQCSKKCPDESNLFSTLATLCALYPKTTPADNLATVRTTAKSSRASSREMWLEESNVTRVVTVVLSIFVARVAYYFS